jgi:hypothetical protein
VIAAAKRANLIESAIARRLNVMEVSESPHYRIESAEGAG